MQILVVLISGVQGVSVNYALYNEEFSQKFFVFFIHNIHVYR